MTTPRKKLAPVPLDPKTEQMLRIILANQVAMMKVLMLVAMDSVETSTKEERDLESRAFITKDFLTDLDRWRPLS